MRKKIDRSLFFVAEIGGNHCGDLEIAKMMIHIAKKCKADAVKFQKRTVKECLKEEEYYAPHPVPRNSYGETYGQHREYLEFSKMEHKVLRDYCKDEEIQYGCSVWDMNAAKEIIDIEPDFIKIPSACNTNKELIEYVGMNYNGFIHVSLGMINYQELDDLISFLKLKPYAKRIILYHCVSGYPVPADDMCLLEIDRLLELSETYFAGLGFSGHHQGTNIDIAAITLGARYIERHYTLNHLLKGTDHMASLEPNEFLELVLKGNEIIKTLKMKPYNMLEIEKIQENKLKWNR